MGRRTHKWDPVCTIPTGLVRPVRVDPEGVAGPTPGQARGPRWRRTTPGFFVPAHVTDDRPEQRILEQSMRLPPQGAVTGWAACRLLGAAFFDGLGRDGQVRLPVPLALGPVGQLRPREGSVLMRDRLYAHEVILVAGIPCVRRERALFDAMRTACDVREATVCMDMMAAAERVSIRMMRDYVALHPAWTGVPLVREALDLASEDSRSPQECRFRLVWELDAGLPRPLVNRPIFSLDGELLGVADLLDPVAGMVGEFNGADHLRPTRQTRDAGREDIMRRVGLEYFTVTGLDMHHRGRVVQRMHATRRRAAFLPEGERAWTIIPPPGWEPDLPLDDRLRLRAEADGWPDTWPA